MSDQQPTKRKPRVHYSKRGSPGSDLHNYGFTRTRAGRWIDTATGKSHLTIEAWAIVNERGGAPVQYLQPDVQPVDRRELRR